MIGEGCAECSRIIMGVDPGLASTGYGFIRFAGNRMRCIEYGVIRTEPAQPQGARLLHIFTQLTALIAAHKPSAAGIETLRFAKNVTSALDVSEARGVTLLAFEQAGIHVKQYAPNAIKKAVTGIATADKKQVQLAVQLLLGLTKLPQPDHAADALAAAVAYINIPDMDMKAFQKDQYVSGSPKGQPEHTLFRRLS